MIAQLGDSSFANMDLRFIKLAATYNAEETLLNNFSELVGVPCVSRTVFSAPSGLKRRADPAATCGNSPPEPKSLFGLSLRARS